MIHKSCNLCRAKDTSLLFKGRDRFHSIPGTYHFVRCHQCGLMYLDPMPTSKELERHYPVDYIPYSKAIDDETNLLTRWDRRYGMYKRYRVVTQVAGREPGRVLDVGCATGNFLDAMRRYGGWQPVGVEPNRQASIYARERLGLEVFTGTLEEAGFEDNSFDVVTMWDVLEHVTDPQATLQEVARVLRIGGILVMSLPNPETWELGLFGSYWVGWDVPRHLHLFTCDVIARYLEETGFELVKTTSFCGRYHVFLLSLDLWARERCPRWRKALMAVLKFWPVKLIGLVFFSISDRIRMSSIMTVFARGVDK
ncbi:MAG: class I SAM-dependent methyltransferase [Candidatus Aminicenantes bacterium]|nr:class I SAM-dependent methyltransferase [Candidatus Aminicenantes bacterium]